MEKVTIGGKEYELLFNMYTMELMEEKYGKTREIINRLASSEEPEVRLVREMFVLMSNTAKYEKGEPEDTDDRILRKMKFDEYQKLQLRQKEIIEMAAGLRSETTGGGKADDDQHDAWLEEDEKNG